MRRIALRYATALVVLASLTGPTLAGELIVSAASSLSLAFQEIARDYQAQHPATTVSLNFGGSGGLMQQIARGAPVDVFASADQETMDLAAAKQLIVDSSRRDFVGNSLVIVVPSGSSVSVNHLSDLEDPEIRRVAIGSPASVPAGRYSQHALKSTGLWPVVSAKAVYAQSVRQVLDYIARAEVDAGFVYHTDAEILADKVRVAYVVPSDRPIRYPIARTASSAHPAEAQRFIDYVLSPAGQTTLQRHGFTQP